MKLLAKPPSSKWPFTRRSFTELRGILRKTNTGSTFSTNSWRDTSHDAALPVWLRLRASLSSLPSPLLVARSKPQNTLPAER